MNTLNYWLGQLQRVQLFGRGVKPLYIKVDGQPDVYEVVAIVQDAERTTLIVE